MTNPAETLIDHALTLRWSDVPETARTAARTFLHDSLCVGVAGRNAPFADAVLTAARAWGEGGDASVLGRPDVRLPASQAAFVNAFQIHSQEFDCVHEPAVVHPLATIVAALFAEAERSGPYSGEALLTALVAGVDVSAGLGVAASKALTAGVCLPALRAGQGRRPDCGGRRDFRRHPDLGGRREPLRPHRGSPSVGRTAGRR